MKTYFDYNGIDSRRMGVLVNTYPPIVRPKARVTTVTVPGRTGDLTFHEDEALYDSYIRTCECTALPDADIPAISAWLAGSGDVVFGNEPLYAYPAQIINQINFEKLLRGHPHKKFDVPFLVQPYKMLAAPGANISISTSGSFVTVQGTLLSRPVIRVTCTGYVELVVGMYLFTISGYTGYAYTFRIDCDAEIVTNVGLTVNQTGKMSGAFPRLAPGTIAVSWTGDVTAVVIEPRFRWL